LTRRTVVRHPNESPGLVDVAKEKMGKLLGRETSLPLSLRTCLVVRVRPT
ncbi:10449_t:CDS:1, partial [Funneliformis geosporum]